MKRFLAGFIVGGAVTYLFPSFWLLFVGLAILVTMIYFSLREPAPEPKWKELEEED